jgi:glycosyltransferase involved in cell wall biosynthesis
MDDMVPQVMVFQLGARMHYAVPIIFHRAGMLQTFYTDFYCSQALRRYLQQNWPELLRRYRKLKSLSERCHHDLPEEKIKFFSSIAFSYHLCDWVVKNDLRKRNNIILWATKMLGRMILTRGFRKPDVLYTFFAEGLPLTLSAVLQDSLKVTEVPISPLTWRLVMEEMQLWPEWSQPGQLDFLKWAEPWGWELGQRHLHASDLVICPSDFVRAGVKEMGVDKDSIVTIPYGFTAVSPFSSDTGNQRAGRGKIKILFMGGLTIRKGVQYLCEAIKLLKSNTIEVHLVGGSNLPLASQKILERHCHLWGQVPRSEAANFFREADIFVFPSIAEGSATVCYEALAAGLPVITTPNSGSVVRNGIDGFIVPIRDPQGLAEKINLLAGNPNLRKEMGVNAMDRAKDFTVERYGERLVGAILARWASENGGPFNI